MLVCIGLWRTWRLQCLFAVIVLCTVGGSCPLDVHGDLILSSQAAVVLSNECTNVPGQLVIDGISVTDLSPLHNLRTVSAGLAVLSSSLRNLSGLEGVSMVGADMEGVSLRLETNHLLESISSLQGLTGPLLGSIIVSQCDALHSLSGLDGVTSLGVGRDGNSLLIQYSALDSLAGLGGVTGALPGSFWIAHCHHLRSLEGQAITAVGVDEVGCSLCLQDLPALISLEALSGLQGFLPGVLWVEDCPVLRSLVGLGGIKTIGRDSLGHSLVVLRSALESFAGLGGLQGALPGSIRIQQCDSLRSLAGLELVTGVGEDIQGMSVYLVSNLALESLVGLGGLTGMIPGELRVQQCSSLRSLWGFENVRSVGKLFISVDHGLCFPQAALAYLNSIQVTVTDAHYRSTVEVHEQDSPEKCMSCASSMDDVPGSDQHCTSAEGFGQHTVHCGVLRGGQCMCPLGLSGPSCELEVPLATLDGSTSFLLQVQEPPIGSYPRTVALPLLLWRTSTTTDSVGLRVIDMQSGTASAGLDYELLEPFDDVEWDSANPERGRIMAYMSIYADLNNTEGTEFVVLGLAYREGTGNDLYPDVVINGTILRENTVTLEFPTCLSTSDCVDRVAVASVQIVDWEACSENMEQNRCLCKQNPFCFGTHQANEHNGSCAEQLDVPFDSPMCECLHNQRPVGICQSVDDYWSPDGLTAVHCPLASVCNEGSECAEGHLGVLCAECESGRALAVMGGACNICGDHGLLQFLFFTGLIIVLAVVLPHKDKLQQIAKRHTALGPSTTCLVWSQGVQSRLPAIGTPTWAVGLPRWNIVSPKLRIALFSLQGLSVWLTTFYLRFPHHVLQLPCFHMLTVSLARVISVVTSLFSQVALLRCVDGFHVLDEYRVLVLLPVLFLVVSFISAWTPAMLSHMRKMRYPQSSDGPTDERPHHMWHKLAFIVTYYSYSTMSSATILHLPITGVAFDCSVAEVHGCRFRNDYSLRLDSTEYSAFQPWVWVAFVVYPIGVPAAYFCCLWRIRKILEERDVDDAAANTVEQQQIAHLATMFSDMHRKRWWFEVVNLARQFFLNAALLLFAFNPTTHLYLSFLVITVYLCMLIFLQPYADPQNNLIQGLWSGVIAIVIVSELAALQGTVLEVGDDMTGQQEWMDILMTGAFLLVFIGVVVVSVWLVFTEIRRQSRQC